MKKIKIDDQIYWMKQALLEAQKAFYQNEVPVGCVIVGKSGQVLSQASNQVVTLNNPCAHAELIALQEACQRINNYRLVGASCFVTLEPCAMCISALVHARIENLYIALKEPKTGACGSVFQLANNPFNNHQINCFFGCLKEESQALLKEFFQSKRIKNKRK